NHAVERIVHRSVAVSSIRLRKLVELVRPVVGVDRCGVVHCLAARVASVEHYVAPQAALNAEGVLVSTRDWPLTRVITYRVTDIRQESGQGTLGAAQNSEGLHCTVRKGVLQCIRAAQEALARGRHIAIQRALESRGLAVAAGQSPLRGGTVEDAGASTQ